ncbi:VanZ family protein [Halorarius litoreus]|uniref:VanZ family protein n=1 Tax=Halorarius litoreus TaxID=2962676 RepID=UPI0020CE5E52|nr:VanZ family protein [Halorarius litoreus]
MNRPRVPVLARPLRLAVVAAVALVILVASVVDPPGSGGATTSLVAGLPLDKWLHALAYAGLASVLAYASVPERGRRGRVLVGVVLLAAGYGFGIELVQATLPFRSFDLLDALANTVGASVGALPWFVVRGR